MVVPSGVFKVFSQNRVQQRRLLWNAFLSGLWSRSLTFLLVVALVRGLLHLLVLQLRILLGFFSHFTPNLKKCEAGFALESEGARQWQPIHAGCSAGGCALAGEGEAEGGDEEEGGGGS